MKRRIFLGDVSELRPADRDERGVPIADAAHPHLVVVESDFGDAHDSFDKMRQFDARRVGLVPALVVLRVGG